MSFTWPTLGQMAYRIMRLRRLIVAAVALSVCVLVAFVLISPELVPMARFGAILATMSALMVLHVALFPNVAIETLVLSATGTGFVAALPWVRGFADMVQPPYHDAALIMIVIGAVLVAIAVTMLAHFLLTVIVYAGPAVRLRLRASMTVPCPVHVARAQFGLRPQTRRGRVLAGESDARGFFDVAVVAYGAQTGITPVVPHVVKVDAKVLGSDDTHHEVMIVLPCGGVTVSAHQFTAKGDRCLVEAIEMPGDFTLGMHVMFWLADQQTDNLVEVADLMRPEPSRANGLAHGVSLLSIAGIVLSPRQPVLD